MANANRTAAETIPLPCPHCGKTIRIPLARAKSGVRGRCPKCRKEATLRLELAPAAVEPEKTGQPVAPPPGDHEQSPTPPPVEVVPEPEPEPPPIDTDGRSRSQRYRPASFHLRGRTILFLLFGSVLLILGSLAYLSASGSLWFLTVLWLFLGLRISAALVPEFLQTVPCPGCGYDFECIGVWGCGCGYNDHREQHILRFKCPVCKERIGRANCPQCQATILIW